ncbi:MAG: alpha-amylase family glycosyl hydrolase [Terracidiphilus sp.]|jgi:glycosidase
MMEFHISRKARERYQFAELLFSYSGNVVFANLTACREFAHRMNTVREVEKHPELAVHAGQLYAMGLIDEASHVLMARYREQFDPQVMTGAIDWFSSIVGPEALGKMLLTFVEDFPGISVMRGEQKPLEWLAGQTDGTSHYAVAFEELLLLWTANRNEAFQPFDELFEEKSLAEKTVYRQVTKQLPEYFATRPLIPVPDAKPMNLLELLRAPAVGAPRSLSDQLALIRKLWKPLLGDRLEHLLAIATEILHEEELAIWMQFNPPDEAARRRRESGKQQWPGVVSTADVPEFGDPAHEYEKFSPDQAWMPTAVLIAKSTYVWLAQMSRQYGRWIKRLDEIPDEELATLARRGLNTLWLIGVWERSRASKTIKQLCGNSDAVASAYSLFDYTIADDLGGEAAYVNLRDRAYRHGIRLASDMVPNHMGIDSPWVVEHPDWFISRPDPPYPVYSFNGPDLSHDGRVEIKIEDHYFEQSDAAVVFRRRDRSSGETRYIYHGNDGTSFPWNDTAQLDYLNPAVREQVIQTILHVARLFPVIRFDAAMTLAKRHFHRLWFPGPGASGAIPSRAEYGMSQAEFDRCMPNEFWREVVDRVAAEVPGTLLLAEAFWLMEGYFVRTLGMHRVYNSAFMVMLRDEENAKYRSVIKKTLEFDPDIMKRYVNFMSNPDERTAIDQFGKGDKCFGVATMMATLPGLPMFGHGQIEGFTEKYGMEYQRPRYDESPDPWLVERHDREIAPLLKRRRLFAESGSFMLYDFFTDSGKVDENVFAYSNRNGNERALVVFNNHYGNTHGTIDYSAAYADKGANQLRQQKVIEGLGIGGNSNSVLAWRDSLTGLEYLRRANDLEQRGLTLDLGAYQCHVFLDWRELYSTQERPWDRLSDQLNGRGVPSLEDALVFLELQPVHDALLALLDSGLVRQFADLAEHPRTVTVGTNTTIEAERAEFFNEAWTRCENLLRAAQKAYLALIGGSGKLAGDQPANPVLLGAAFRGRLRAAMRIPSVEVLFPAPWSPAARRMLPSPSPQLTATAMWGPVLGWCCLELLAESFDAEKPEPIALDLFDRLRLREPFAQVFTALGFENEEAWRVAARVKVGLLTGAGAGAGKPEETSVEAIPLAAEPAPFPVEREAVAPALSPTLWLDPDVRWLTGVHSAGGYEFLVREPYEELLWWLLMPSLLRLASETAPGRAARNRAAVEAMSGSIEEALATAEAAGYRVDLLMAAEAGEAAEPGVEAVASTAAEPAIEAVIEPEVSAEAEPLVAAEVLETVEPKSDAPIEPEVDAAAEAESPIEAQPEAFEPLKALDLEAEPVIELANQPAIEAETELEPAAGAAPASAEETELVEPECETVGEPVPESAVEPLAEVAAEAEPSADAERATADQPEPVEAGIDSDVESVAETEAEPEASLEAAPWLGEELEPADPETRLAVNPSTEAVVEAETEPAAVPVIESVAEAGAEPSAEVEPVPVEEPEPVDQQSKATQEPTAELAGETVAESVADFTPEAVVEFEAECEASSQVGPAPTEDAVQVEQASGAAIEPTTEAGVEAFAEPELPAQIELVSVDALGLGEPAIESAIEPVRGGVTQEAVELEGREGFRPPIEPQEALEPEEPTAALVTEEFVLPVSPLPPGFFASAEAETGPEQSAATEHVSGEESEPIEAETEATVVPNVEIAFEPFERTEVQPAPAPESEVESSEDQAQFESADEPAFRLSDYFIAKAEADPEPDEHPQDDFSAALKPRPVVPESEYAIESAIEPASDATPKPSSDERWEPDAPRLEFTARLVSEARTIAKALHSFTERWEPPAPKIEFAAQPPAEATPGADKPPSAAQRWEPPTQKIEQPAQPVAEPKTMAELLRLLNEHWEPDAPKVEFAAKPAADAEVSKEEQAPEPLKSPEQGVGSGKRPADEKSEPM